MRAFGQELTLAGRDELLMFMGVCFNNGQVLWRRRCRGQRGEVIDEEGERLEGINIFMPVMWR